MPETNTKRTQEEHPESSNDFCLTPIDNQRFADLCGALNEHLHTIEAQLNVVINTRGQRFTIQGADLDVAIASKVLQRLYAETENGNSCHIDPDKVFLFIKEARQHFMHEQPKSQSDIAIPCQKGLLRPRGENQERYMKRILNNDINFGIGPAGTGKTFLAVACAVEALEKELVNRLILVRPAVEAGERLGFLPGNLAEKIDPYLRPLYDALYHMLGAEKVGRLMEKQIIEIAPLAYMRGRTLSDAFVILDEGQNTTREQMKMFLTRIGFGSKAVITGDITQIDLPNNQQSGLKHALQILKDINGISITRFATEDVVRHPLVQSVIEAYQESNKDK